MAEAKARKPRTPRKPPVQNVADVEEILLAQENLNKDSHQTEVEELVQEQASFALPHPAGTMDPQEILEGPTVLADRSNGQKNRRNEISISGPKNAGDAPIAVVSPDGTVYPFSGELRDRMALLGYDVTYIYNVDDARKVIAHNERMHREDNVDRVVHGLQMTPAPVSTAADGQQLKESVAVAFSPEMLA